MVSRQPHLKNLLIRFCLVIICDLLIVFTHGTPQPNEFIDGINTTNIIDVIPCAINEFRCHATKNCIPNRYRCYEHIDCQNEDIPKSYCDSCVNQVSHRAPAFDDIFCNITRKCIASKYRCDNKNDCGEGDLSDESNCANCSEGEFRCDRGSRCIPLESKCNGLPDCEDESDEKNCDSCKSHSYHCKRSRNCAPVIVKCSGEEICGGDNLLDNICESCSQMGFFCNITKKCIKFHDRCDGNEDCGVGDNSDEDNCEICLVNQFQCRTTKNCISNRDRCNGKWNCGDGDKSDEKNCGRCSPYSFQCNVTNDCIPYTSRCDGKRDCGLNDDSDEVNCDVCPENYSICHKDGERQCLPQIFRCDGITHCENSSDEKNCDSCSRNSVYCKSTKRCMLLGRIKHCPDDNTLQQRAIASIAVRNAFQCKTTKHYLHQGLRCDGFPDCGLDDRSDEENCDSCISWGLEHPIHDLFHCGLARRCLPFFRKCNGLYDCGNEDFSDEEDCGLELFDFTNITDFAKTDTLTFRSTILPPNLSSYFASNATKITFILRRSNGSKIEVDSKRYRVILNKLKKETLTYHLVLEIYNATVTDSGTFTLQVTVLDQNGDMQVFNFFVIIKVKNLLPEFSYTNLQNSTVSFSPGQSLNLICILGNQLLQTKVTWKWENLSVSDWPTALNFSFEKNFEVLKIVAMPINYPGRFSCTAENSKGIVTVYADIIVEHTNPYNILGPVIGTLSLLVVCLGASVLWYKCKQKHLHRNAFGISEMEFYKGGLENLNPNINVNEQANLLPFEKNKWEISREMIKLDTPLGSGAFGLVLKAQLFQALDNHDDGFSTVAVKTMKACADQNHFKALLMELKVMANMGKHLNIVNLIGACTQNFTRTGELLIVMEFCKYGSLLSYLLDNRNSFINQINPVTDQIDLTTCERKTGKNENLNEQPMDRPTEQMQDSNESVQDLYQGDYQLNDVTSIKTTDLISWSFQIAKGMEYLSSKKILHGDLAARNVLLAEENIAKICDFGYARATFQNYDYQKDTKGQLLPLKWMAIESLYRGVFSSKSDCWSYGILLWEIFSLGNKPYPGMQVDEFFCQRLSNGYRMEKPSNAPTSVYEIMMDCWKEDPAQRPKFSHVSNLLLEMMSDMEEERLGEMDDIYTGLNEINEQPESMDSPCLLSEQLPDSQYGPEPRCSITGNVGKSGFAKFSKA